MENKKFIRKGILLATLAIVTTLIISDVAYWASSKIELNFCNSWNFTNSLNFEDVSPWWERDICIQATNKWENQETVQMYFVDWLVNPYTPQFIACWDDKRAKKDLWKFASFIENWKSEEKLEITLGPWEKIEKRAKVVFPSDYAWISKWCLISTTVDQKVIWWKINIKFRKWNIIKAIVDKEVALEKQKVEDNDIKIKWLIVWLSMSAKSDSSVFHWSWDKWESVKVKVIYQDEKFIIYSDKSWKVYIVTELKNTWNVKLKWQFIANIRNSFWYKYFEKTDEEILEPGRSKEVRIILDDLPFYKWSFNANMELTYNPEFDPSITNIPDNLKNPIIEKYNIKFSLSVVQWFAINVVIVFILWIIILIAVIVARKNMMMKYAKTYVVKDWDTIMWVADKFWCNWKQIARLNNIKSPYVLEENSKIMVCDYSSKNKK